MIMKKLAAAAIAAMTMFAFVLPQTGILAVESSVTTPTAPTANITGYEVAIKGGGSMINKGMTFDVTIYTDIAKAAGDSGVGASIGSCQFTPVVGTLSEAGGKYTFNFNGVKYNGGDTTLKVKVNVTNGGIVTTNVLTTSITEAVNAPDATPGSTTPEPPAGTPTFEVYSNSNFLMNAGESRSISIYLQNISSQMAKGLTATISDPKGVVTFPTGNIYKTTSEIEEFERKSVSFTIEVPAATPAGSYPLDLKVATTNEDGAASTSTIQIFLEVKSNIRMAALDVTEYSIDKKVVKDGDVFNVTIKLKNNTGVDLTDVKLGFTGLDGVKFAMNGGLPFATVKIAKDKEFSLKVGLIACAGIASIREILPFEATYRIVPSNKETEQKIVTNMTIPCIKPADKVEEGDILAPNIIITKYDFGAEYVTGGEVFPLSLTFQNASAVTSIQNLKVTVQGVQGTGENAGIAFSPANSSNSFFFPSLGVGGSQDINIDLLPRADAKPNSYPIQVTFSYEYLAGGKSKKAEPINETLTIPLQQEDRFTANPIELGQQTAYTGQEFPVMATFVNKGKSAVNNVSVDVEGTGFDKTSTATYIGNVDSGKEEFYETRIIPTAEGQLKGEVVVKYEDANSKEKELRIEFMVTVMAMEPGGNMGGNMTGGSIDIGGMVGPDGKPVGGEAKTGLPLWAKIVIPAGAVVVVGVGVVFTLKLLKKKKLRKIEIEDSDEDI